MESTVTQVYQTSVTGIKEGSLEEQVIPTVMIHFKDDLGTERMLKFSEGDVIEIEHLPSGRVAIKLELPDFKVIRKAPTPIKTA